MRKLFIYIFLITCSALSLYGQGEIDLQKRVFFRNERTFAISIQTRGYGVNYRYAKRLDAFRKTTYEGEFNYIKHPKEIKAQLNQTNNNIIYGKLNSVFTLKGGLGFQKELFQKLDVGGISIRYFTNFGPSIMFLKPVYYEYIENTSPNQTITDKFKPHTSKSQLYGKAPFSKGFNEITLNPGAYGKFGFSFEYSKLDESFHALETGISLDAYIRSFNIIDTPTNNVLFFLPDDQFIVSLFASYRFGKIIDTKQNPKKNRIDKMINNER